MTSPPRLRVAAIEREARDLARLLPRLTHVHRRRHHRYRARRRRVGHDDVEGALAGRADDVSDLAVWAVDVDLRAHQAADVLEVQNLLGGVAELEPSALVAVRVRRPADRGWRDYLDALALDELDALAVVAERQPPCHGALPVLALRERDLSGVRLSRFCESV